MNKIFQKIYDYFYKEYVGEYYLIKGWNYFHILTNITPDRFNQKMRHGKVIKTNHPEALNERISFHKDCILLRDEDLNKIEERFNLEVL